MRVLLLVLLMAIGAPSSTGSNKNASSPSVSIAVTVAITTGETGWVYFGDEEGTAATVTSITGGGTWTRAVQFTRTGVARMHGEIWTTPAGGAASASSITINFSGAPNAIIAFAASYPGVIAIGTTATNGASSTNPTVSLTTQDANNWSIAGISTWTAVAPTAGTGNLRKTDFVAGASDIGGGLVDNTVVSPGSVTTSVSQASSEWVALAVEFRSTSGASTFYLNNPVQGGSFAGLLTPTAPTASTSTTGWTVGTTGATNYSRMTYNLEVSAGNFTSTAQPSGVPVNSGEDCFRLSGVTTGQFSAGTWYSSLSVIAVSSGGVQDTRARFRIYRSANADLTGATELTQGAMIGSRTTGLDTSAAQSSSASTFIAASNLTNEFLFMQVALEVL